MKLLVRLGLMLLLVAASATASEPPLPQGPVQEQTALPEGNSLYNAASPFRLFDPSRLTMRQSYSVSYMTGGGVSRSVGMYMNSIGYQIARPLYVQFDLGIVHDPGSLFGGGNVSHGARILPNFMLRYTPSPKFQLIVDVRTMPGSQGYYGAPGYGYYSPWMR